MIFGSLFAGIGGFDLGLERAGMTCAFQVENAEFPRRVLEKHWPNVPKFGDIRGVGAHNLPPVDLLCGGFPCQDISSAGKGAGITGARSGLWKEYHRLINELRPKYVLIENVSRLRTRGLETVLTDLAASGYDAEWDCLTGYSVGAPHQRDRIFIVAYTDGEHKQYVFGGSGDEGDAPLASTGAVDADDEDRGENVVSNRKRKRLEGHTRYGEIFRPEIASGSTGKTRIRHREHAERWWVSEPSICRVANGVPDRVDRIISLGNAVIPQIIEIIGRLILEFDERRVTE